MSHGQKWKRLGSYLKDKRLESGFSQRHVARKLKYGSPQFISNWERGVSSPPLKKINELINIYGLSKREVIKIILDETRDHLEKNIVGMRKLASDLGGYYVR